MDTSGLASLALAFGLSSVIGLERQLRQKSAGLRTHTLVGVGAALFTLAGGTGSAERERPSIPPASPPRSSRASGSSARG